MIDFIKELLLDQSPFEATEVTALTLFLAAKVKKSTKNTKWPPEIWFGLEIFWSENKSCSFL